MRSETEIFNPPDKNMATGVWGEQLLSVLDAVPAFILYVDSDERICFANETAVRWLKRSRRHIFGQQLIELLGKSLYEQNRLFREYALAGEEISFVDEETYPDGMTRYTESRYLPQFGDGGEVLGYCIFTEDATERHKAELALQKSEARLRDITDAVSDWLWETDAKLRLKQLSGRFREITGQNPSSLLGRQMTELTGKPADPAAWKRHLKELEKGQAFRDVLYDLRLPNGAVRYVRLSGKPILDSNGKFHGYRGTGTDITEENTARQELQELSRRNELILETAGDGIYGVDLEGKTTFVNRAATEITGWRADELIGRSQHELIHHTKADGSPYPQKECPIYGAFRRGAACQVDNEVFWRKDGTSFPVEYMSTPMVEDGRITGAVVTFRDITERLRVERDLRQSEQRLAQAQRLSGLGNWEWDVNRRVLIWSDQSYRLVGLEPQDDIPTSRFSKMVHPDDLPALRETSQAALRGEKPYDIEYRVRRTDGEVRMFHSLGEVVRDESGVPIRMFGTAIDITERKRAEEALREAKAEAEWASRAKSEFLANMSHELRTPLNAILGFAEMISLEQIGPIGEEKYLEYASFISESGRHLLSIINDILDLSKVEAGKLDLQEGQIELVPMFEACLRLVAERAEKAGVRLLPSLDEAMSSCQCEVESALLGDERMVKQILVNLLSNAVKFTPDGGQVEVKCQLDEEKRIVISVSDSGIGIAPEDIATVLAPFGQVAGTLSRQHQGTGLGVPLVKSLAELHGAEFEMNSEVGKGTIVTIRFPADRTLSTAADPAADSAVKTS
jgi:PAS domain S-box-containing protein